MRRPVAVKDTKVPARDHVEVEVGADFGELGGGEGRDVGFGAEEPVFFGAPPEESEFEGWAVVRGGGGEGEEEGGAAAVVVDAGAGLDGVEVGAELGVLGFGFKEECICGDGGYLQR